MCNIWWLSIHSLLNIFLVSGTTYTSVINTESGPVRGLISKTIENLDYASFKGIPYAKPPIDELRFKPPVEIDAWTDIYDATDDGDICPQWDDTSKSVVGSENCLYINVFTPHTEFNGAIPKAVMVFIHGGGFVMGDSKQSTTGPDFILGKDVILVSFNYRLSAFGFLNLEHENAMGNCAFKDQNLALKWVKKNIVHFGGNPDKITIFGQSAGAVAVDFQVLSDMSKGLFTQSISMSGSTLCLYWGFQRRKEAVKQAFMLGSKLGTNTGNKDVLLKTLYNASTVDIIKAGIGLTIPFRPSLENPAISPNQEKFLTECSLRKYATGNYIKGPHMMGFTAQEALGFFNNIFAVAASAIESIEIITGKIPLLSNIAKAITNGIGNLAQGAYDNLVQTITDLLFVVGIDTKQKLISRTNNYPIYYYRFSFVPNNLFNKSRLKLEGASHSYDLPYIFYMPKSFPLPSNQSDIKDTRQRMLKLYTNFAKYGNPTPDGDNDKVLGITWPDSRSNGKHLEIGKILTIGPRPTTPFVQILQLFGVAQSPVLNDCVNG